MMSDVIHINDLETRLKRGEEVVISFRYPTDDFIVSINSLIARALSGIDRIFVLDSVITILRELIVNAVKANSKRVYFEKEGLDINNPADYETGMEKFMNRVMKNLDHFREELEKSRFTITLKVRFSPEMIALSVVNNITLLSVESARISVRRKMAGEYDNFSEAYAAFYDPSEGAGLGIILIVFLLRNAGIDARNFQISQEREGVNTTITIPFQVRKEEITGIIKEKILKEIDTLPALPENILTLLTMCRQKDASIREIADTIIRDPSLTAEILRIANTAGFYTVKKTDNLDAAVMRMGLRTLESILLVTGTKSVLAQRHKYFKKVWEHSNKVAFYGRAIAVEFGYMDISDKVFISGLLHDMGKIVLLSVDAELAGQISEIAKNREIRSSTLIEEIAIGISHSSIGGLIAEKWNFPRYIVEAIRHHHTPFSCPGAYSDICRIVYLANMFCGIIEKKYNPLFIETEILESIGIGEEDALFDYLRQLQKTYLSHPGV